MTADDRCSILMAYQQGQSGREIGARFGCDPSYPTVLARRYGWDLKKGTDRDRRDRNGRRPQVAS